jgi:hypothetical protein
MNFYGVIALVILGLVVAAWLLSGDDDDRR